MGYSATSAAFNTLRAIEARLGKEFQNDLDGKGFWDIGRENADGAITGSVMAHAGTLGNYAKPAGNFRIEPDGEITRFPLIPKALWGELVAAGKRPYTLGARR